MINKKTFLLPSCCPPHHVKPPPPQGHIQPSKVLPPQGQTPRQVRWRLCPRWPACLRSTGRSSPSESGTSSRLQVDIIILSQSPTRNCQLVVYEINDPWKSQKKWNNEVDTLSFSCSGLLLLLVASYKSSREVGREDEKSCGGWVCCPQCSVGVLCHRLSRLKTDSDHAQITFKPD